MNNHQLPDMQATPDTRGVFIQKVGIRGYEAPIRVMQKDGDITHTVANFSLYSSLNEEVKGVNMSRFSRTITEEIAKVPVGVQFMTDVLDTMKEKLEGRDSYVKIRFPYFETKAAPVSKTISFVKRDVVFEGYLKDGVKRLFLTVEANFTSLCPCSKEMSLIGPETGLGAHNQKSICSIRVELIPNTPIIWIEDLADIVDSEGSCFIVNALKREDEKYVTERAYNNPKFCEDMARDVSLRVQAYNTPFSVVVENFESIHQSTAIAIVDGGLG